MGMWHTQAHSALQGLHAQFGCTRRLFEACVGRFGSASSSSSSSSQGPDAFFGILRDFRQVDVRVCACVRLFVCVCVCLFVCVFVYVCVCCSCVHSRLHSFVRWLGGRLLVCLLVCCVVVLSCLVVSSLILPHRISSHLMSHLIGHAGVVCCQQGQRGSPRSSGQRGVVAAAQAAAGGGQAAKKTGEGAAAGETIVGKFVNFFVKTLKILSTFFNNNSFICRRSARRRRQAPCSACRPRGS